MYTKGQAITVKHPKGTAAKSVSFLRYNKEETKFQFRSLIDGRLWWAGVDCIVDAVSKAGVKASNAGEALAKLKLKTPDSTIEQASKEAQEKLAEIKRKKDAPNNIKNKGSVKSIVMDLVKQGKTNKEIFNEVNCDSSYPTDARKELFLTGQIGYELLFLKSDGGVKVPDFTFMHSFGDTVDVQDANGSVSGGKVIRPKKYKIKTINVEFHSSESDEFITLEFNRTDGLLTNGSTDYKLLN